MNRGRGNIAAASARIALALCGVLAASAGSPAATAPGAAGTRAPRGQSYEFRGDAVKLSVHSTALYAPRFGFAPFRIATESTDARDLEWQLTAQAQFHSNFGAAVVVSEGVLPVPARRVAERWVFVPLAGDGIDSPGAGYSWHNFTGTIAGRGIEPAIFNLGPLPTHGGPGGGARVMVEPCATSLALEPALRSWLNRRTSGNLNLVALDLAQPLPDWRAWSPFGRVILRTADYEALDPATRVALHGWVALGGTLHLIAEPAAAAAQKPHGAGFILTSARPAPSPEAAAARPGPTPKGAAAPLTEEETFAESLMHATPAQPARDELHLGASDLAAQVSGVPPGADWLIYFFVVFAVLIAPVNLFVIAPARRRQRLFLTVPAFSLGAVLILGVMILVQDGVGGAGARRALVVLLPGENQAAVFQEQITRTGLLLGGSFPLPDDTLCAQVPVDQNSTHASLVFRRQEGVASGDWFRSRTRQGQHLRRLTPTRARVELIGIDPAGAPMVQSSIGATLRDFLFLDAQGVWWSADEIGPGQRIALTRQDDAVAQPRSLIEFDRRGSAVFRELMQRAGLGQLRRGSFVARAGDNDLAPLPTLGAIRWSESSVVFTGAVEGKALP